MNKLITTFTLAVTLALTGCSGTNSRSTGVADSSATDATTQEADLSGAWKQSNSPSEDSYQQATISDGTITIDWATEGGDTTSIYWVGTFEAPTDASGPYTWTSQRDAAATDSALLASTDETKEFTYESGTISYEVSALGTTTMVELKKK